MPVEQIRRLLYTPSADLPDGAVRIPLKVIHVNRAPVVVPMGTLSDTAREQWAMDADQEKTHLKVLQSASGLAEKVAAVFDDAEQFPPQSDPDKDLYGGFLSDQDRRLCERVRATEPADLAELELAFEAPKLHELLFRYRARNWPASLDPDERQRWEEYRRYRLSEPGGGGSITLDGYRRRLSQLAVDNSLSTAQRAVVDALLDWPAELGF